MKEIIKENIIYLMEPGIPSQQDQLHYSREKDEKTDVYLHAKAKGVMQP